VLSVLQRVHRRLRQENLLPVRVHLELLVKRVIPQVLHVVPLLDNAVLHGVADLEHGAGGSRVVAAHDVLDDNIAVGPFLRSQDGPAHDGRELVLGEVLRGISDLEEAGAAVEDWSAE
jgi:DUF1009 family protein